MPVATGMVKEKFPIDSILNMTSANKKIIQNVTSTGTWKRNP